MKRSLPTALILLLLLAPALRAQEDEKKQTFVDRSEIPGHYTVGLYADDEGRSRHVKIDEDQETVEAWIGITGDEMRIFSGLVFRLELPPTVSLAGPIRWRSIPGLEQKGSAIDDGMEVAFPASCQRMRGDRPAILGRVSLRLRSDFERAEVAPEAHRRWGLSVELCSDEMAWPKPYAEAVPLTIERKGGLLQTIKSWFQ